MQIGRLTVDTARREVQVGGDVVELTPASSISLAYLVSNRGLALSRRQLLDGVWGGTGTETSAPSTCTFANCARSSARIFPSHTVWGVGYRLG